MAQLTIPVHETARPAPYRHDGRWWTRLGWRPVHYAFILFLHEHFFRSGRKCGEGDWRYVFYPWADAVRISILKYHEFPWWNPWSLSGQPLFADPQTAVLMPDTLFVLMFGSVVGLKIAVVFYFLVGYEGTRFLCRELFGRSRLVDGLAIIPVLVAPLALHLNEGHLVLLTFYLFPWLLGLALTWHRSALRSLALGFVTGCYVLGYIHYATIISATLVVPVVLVTLWRHARSSQTWLRLAFVGCTGLALSFTRLCVTWALVSRFPRVEKAHYPIAYPFGNIVATLVQPFQDRTSDFQVAELQSWELGCYVGVVAVFLAYEGFRQGGRRLWPIYVAAVLCLLLAWNNRDRWFPGYWLHFIRPWAYMLIITRWRLFACYFLLLAAVQGLIGIRREGRPLVAAALGLFVTLDLGFHVAYAYRKTFSGDEPPFVSAADPPKTVADHESDTWADLRANRSSAGAECTLLGYEHPPPNRVHWGDKGYVGEFFGHAPVRVEHWSPNHIVLRGTPGDVVTLNVNPSSYWLMNGARLSPKYRPFEISEVFRVTVPASGRMDFLPRPPHWRTLLGVQAAFCVISVLLFLQCSRRLGRLSWPRRLARC